MVEEVSYGKIIMSASAVVLVKDYKIEVIRASPTPAVYELAREFSKAL